MPLKVTGCPFIQRKVTQQTHTQFHSLLKSSDEPQQPPPLQTLSHNPSSVSPPEANDWRMLLLRAAREQQLQHLPLQEVPQHVRGAEANWPVQVWKQNRAGSEGNPLSAHVCQVLTWALPGGAGGHRAPTKRCDGNEATVPSTLPQTAVTLDCLIRTVIIFS